MSEVRFRVQGVRVGSAARSAEAAASENPTPVRPVVRAGSSARMAEDAKRNGELPSAAMPSISLRAQGGRVVQRPVGGSVPQTLSPAKDVVPDGTPAVSAPSLATTSEQAAPIAEGNGDARPSPAAPLATVAGRLSSMLRTLFQPAPRV